MRALQCLLNPLIFFLVAPHIIYVRNILSVKQSLNSVTRLLLGHKNSVKLKTKKGFNSAVALWVTPYRIVLISVYLFMIVLGFIGGLTFKSTLPVYNNVFFTPFAKGILTASIIALLGDLLTRINLSYSAALVYAGRFEKMRKAFTPLGSLLFFLSFNVWGFYLAYACWKGSITIPGVASLMNVIPFPIVFVATTILFILVIMILFEILAFFINVTGELSLEDENCHCECDNNEDDV